MKKKRQMSFFYSLNDNNNSAPSLTSELDCFFIVLKFFTPLIEYFKITFLYYVILFLFI